MLGGAAVSIGLPLLDCFLNGNGTALAQGAPLPVRFGTWFWGCGMNPDRWVPSDGRRGLRPAAGAGGAGAGARARQRAERLQHGARWTAEPAALDRRDGDADRFGAGGRAGSAGADARRADLGADRHDDALSIARSERHRRARSELQPRQREHRQRQHGLAARALRADLRRRLLRSQRGAVRARSEDRAAQERVVGGARRRDAPRGAARQPRSAAPRSVLHLAAPAREPDRSLAHAARPGRLHAAARAGGRERRARISTRPRARTG